MCSRTNSWAVVIAIRSKLTGTPVVGLQLQVQRSGAGLALKYQIDSSAASQLLPGQSPAQAAFEGHMAFCHYLARHRLAVDVWDGDSLLQVSVREKEQELPGYSAS